jgi:acetyltransferase-like isoleucine patch superfamily enzyme
MKSHWTDYFYSGVVISLLLALAAWPVIAARGFMEMLLGPYHVVAAVGLLLVSYGLASALTLRCMLAIKPMPLGTHGQDSGAFAYWKLLTVVYRLGFGALGWCTPFFLQPVRVALFGTRVGPDVAMGGTIDDPYLVRVGARSVLGNASLVSANAINGGQLICQPVWIGDDVTVGANAIVMPGVTIGDGATVMSGAVVMPGSTIPAGESWRGNPARKWL